MQRCCCTKPGESLPAFGDAALLAATRAGAGFVADAQHATIALGHVLQAAVADGASCGLVAMQALAQSVECRTGHGSVLCLVVVHIDRAAFADRQAEVLIVETLGSRLHGTAPCSSAPPVFPE